MYVLNRSEKQMAICWTPGQSGSGSTLALHVTLKAGFRLRHGGVAELVEEEVDGPMGDTPDPNGGCPGLYYPSDFTPRKPRGEILVTGSAYPPPGPTRSAFRAGLQAGAIAKELIVFGPRRWEGGLLSVRPGPAATPTTPVPLSYANAFGGPGSPFNPIGVGKDGVEMHRFEHPNLPVTTPAQSAPPAGFGPIPAEWAPRIGRQGTFTKDYAATRWPWWPEDFDRRFFQTAPEDQQIDGYWRGDEPLVFLNLHPSVPALRCTLPGLHARCFARPISNWRRGLSRGDRQFEVSEIPLVLDTIWANPEREKLVLCWRGEFSIRSILFPEIHALWCVLEPIGSSGITRDMVAADLAQLDIIDSPPAPPASEEQPPAETPTPPEEDSASDPRIRELFSNAATALSALRPQSPESEITDEARQAFADMRKYADWASAHGEELVAAAQASVPEEEMTPPAADERDPAAAADAAAARIKELDEKFAEVEASLPTSPRWEDFWKDDQMQVEELRKQGAKNIDFSGAPLAGLNLSQIDFSGAVFSGVDLKDVDFSKSSLQGAALDDCDLTGVRFSGTNLSLARLTRARVQGVVWDGALCGSVTFEEIDFRGHDLTGLQAPSASFRKCQMQETTLDRALLPMAEFPDCDLSGTKVRDAILSGADLRGCPAAGMDFSRSHLEALRADDATTFEGSTFHEVSGTGLIIEGSNISGCDFLRSDLQGARFVGTVAAGARFEKCDLRKTAFDDADLTGARMDFANAMQATFDRADCTDAILDGGNLFEASFWESTLHRASWRGAYTPRTRLAAAD